MAISNIKDIIAFGFKPEKTFIFMDTQYIQHLYPNTIKVQKLITINQTKGLFGFNDSDNVGKYAYPPIQTVPSFSNTFPHIFGGRTDVPSLIPCAIDQDPYFRMTRDIAGRLKYEKCSCIYSTFFPALQGPKAKMSSSDSNSSILLSDSPADVKRKINKYAMSGGGATLEEQRANGANLDVDVPYQYLRFFLEDDEKLAEIAEKYGKGEMLTGEVKAVLIDVLNKFLKEFQERRANVTDQDVENFMKIRKIDPVPTKFANKL
jgi:tryptophanyl-tRNA synthetase